MTRTADPLGGSYYVEALTDEIERRARGGDGRDRAQRRRRSPASRTARWSARWPTPRTASSRPSSAASARSWASTSSLTPRPRPRAWCPCTAARGGGRPPARAPRARPRRARRRRPRGGPRPPRGRGPRGRQPDAGDRRGRRGLRRRSARSATAWSRSSAVTPPRGWCDCSRPCCAAPRPRRASRRPARRHPLERLVARRAERREMPSGVEIDAPRAGVELVCPGTAGLADRRVPRPPRRPVCTTSPCASTEPLGACVTRLEAEAVRVIGDDRSRSADGRPSLFLHPSTMGGVLVELVEGAAWVSAAAPLEGVRVLDLTRYVAGPYATRCWPTSAPPCSRSSGPGRGDATAARGRCSPPGGSGQLPDAQPRQAQPSPSTCAARRARASCTACSTKPTSWSRTSRPGSMARLRARLRGPARAPPAPGLLSRSPASASAGPDAGRGATTWCSRPRAVCSP